MRCPLIRSRTNMVQHAMVLMQVLVGTYGLAASQLWEGDWPAFGKSSNFQSFTNASLPAASAKEWVHTGQSRYVASPAVANKTVFLGSDGGYVLALDQETGSLKWSFEVPNGTTSGDHCGPRGNCVRSSPSVLKDGGIVFGSYDSNVYKLDSTGKLVWQYTTGGKIYAPVTVDTDGTLYTGAFDAYTYALNPDGTLKWKFKASGQMNGAPAIGEGQYADYLVTGDGEGGGCLPIPGPGHNNADDDEVPGVCNLYCLDKKTGTLKWKVVLGQPAGGAPVIVGDKVFAGSWNEKVMSLDLETGKVNWEYNAGGIIESHPAYYGGTLYISTEDSMSVIALEASTGNVVWKFTGATQELNSSPTLTENFVFVGSNDKYLYALDRKTGALKFKFETCAHVFASPAVADNGMVYVTCNSQTGHPLDIGAGSGTAYAINPTLHLKEE